MAPCVGIDLIQIVNSCCFFLHFFFFSEHSEYSLHSEKEHKKSNKMCQISIGTSVGTSQNLNSCWCPGYLGHQIISIREVLVQVKHASVLSCAFVSETWKHVTFFYTLWFCFTSQTGLQCQLMYWEQPILVQHALTNNSLALNHHSMFSQELPFMSMRWLWLMSTGLWQSSLTIHSSICASMMITNSALNLLINNLRQSQVNIAGASIQT